MSTVVLLAACTIAQLHLAQGDSPSEATGQHTAVVVLTNTSTRACTVDGYPRITLLDARGRALPFTYTHHGDQMIRRARPRVVRVRAGGHVYFAFNKYRCDFRTLDVARFVRVRLPGVPASSSLRLGHYPIIDWCRRGPPSGVIAVSPLRPSIR